LVVWLIKPKFATRTDLIVGEGLDLRWFATNEDDETGNNKLESAIAK